MALINPMYEAVLLERRTEYSFSRRLPLDATLEHFIVELRPYPGQDAQTLAHWLEHVTIGSEDLLPVLMRLRLSGATCAAVSARDLPGLNVSDDAQLFRISVSHLDLNGKSLPAVSGGDMLVIEHAMHTQGPSAILWHQATSRYPGPISHA